MTIEVVELNPVASIGMAGKPAKALTQPVVTKSAETAVFPAATPEDMLKAAAAALEGSCRDADWMSEF